MLCVCVWERSGVSEAGIGLTGAESQGLRAHIHSYALGLSLPSIIPEDTCLRLVCASLIHESGFWFLWFTPPGLGLIKHAAAPLWGVCMWRAPCLRVFVGAYRVCLAKVSVSLL